MRYSATSLSRRQADSSVRLLTVLVVLGMIGMEEFHRMMVGIDNAHIDEDFLSDAFIERLSDYYRDLLV